MNKPIDTQFNCTYLKLKWEGILSCLKPKTDCKYYHGSSLFDEAKINKFLNCQILMTDF